MEELNNFQFTWKWLFSIVWSVVVYTFFRKATHVELKFRSIWFICHIWFLLFFSFHFARKFKRTNIKWMPNGIIYMWMKYLRILFQKCSHSLSRHKCHAFDAFCCHCNGLYSIWTLQRRRKKREDKMLSRYMKAIIIIIVVCTVFFFHFVSNGIGMEKLTYAITFLVVICS